MQAQGIPYPAGYWTSDRGHWHISGHQQADVKVQPQVGTLPRPLKAEEEQQLINTDLIITRIITKTQNIMCYYTYKPIKKINAM